MKKKSSRIFLLLIVAVFLAACHSAPDSKAAGEAGAVETAETAGKVETADAAETANAAETVVKKPVETEQGEAGQESSRILLDGEGRGDLFPAEQPYAKIPVLVGGALPFTGMKNLRTENYTDGSYYYQDMTEDGSMVFVNCAFASTGNEAQSMEDYAETAVIMVAEDPDLAEILSVRQDETYTARISYPVYIISFRTGKNEDTREWMAYLTETDQDTYLYALSEMADQAEDLEELANDLFAKLSLSDPE